MGDHEAEVHGLLHRFDLAVLHEEGPRLAAEITSDKGFLSFLHLRFTVRGLLLKAEGALQSAVLQPMHGEDQRLLGYTARSQALQALAARAQAVLAEFTAEALQSLDPSVDPPPAPPSPPQPVAAPTGSGSDAPQPIFVPRVLRLAREYGLGDHESRALQFLLVKQACTSLPAATDFSGQPDVVNMCQLSPHLLNLFVHDDRRHVKEGVVIQAEQYGDPCPTLSAETVAVLTGEPLTNDQYLKLNKTLLRVLEAGGTKPVLVRSLSGKFRPPGAQRTPAPEDGADAQAEAEWRALVQGAASNADATAATDDAGSGANPPSELGGSSDDNGDVALPMAPDGSVDVAALMQELQLKETATVAPVAEGAEGGDARTAEPSNQPPMRAYESDLEYLADQFTRMSVVLQLATVSLRLEMKKEEVADQFGRRWREAGPSESARKRELEAKLRRWDTQVSARLELTLARSAWVPRLEGLARSLHLRPFDKDVIVLLAGAQISDLVKMHFSEYNPTVGVLLRILLSGGTFEQQVLHRVHFYKSSTLVASSLIRVEPCDSSQQDLTNQLVSVDRRVLDFVSGLDTELDELVAGSRLYSPRVKLDQVVLPAAQKKLILDTAASFDAYKKQRLQLGLDETMTYGAGVAILLYGPSGVGKTMMVNGIANHLSKRVLLINFPSLGLNSAGDNFKWLFREARINEAVIFFDECESLFESRDKSGSKSVNMLLTEMERHEGLVFLATNRPFDIDEAMHRRLTLALEFRAPDHLLRLRIWESHVPKALVLAEDVDLNAISLKYELTGGFIKNALVSALLIAIARGGDEAENPRICQADLVAGCKLQLRGSLQMKSFRQRVVPQSGFESLVLSAEQHEQLVEIAHFEKARAVLFGQWGFGDQMKERQGTTALFYGPPGTGKTNAAEALGFEIGKPLKIVNSAQLVSKYVGDTGKNIEGVFAEATKMDAILVFDEAEGLFAARTGGSSAAERHAALDTGLLLYHLERFRGVTVLITNLRGVIDTAFFRRIKFEVHFDIPGEALRRQLWRKFIPATAPTAADVDFETLGRRYKFAGGSISTAVFRAASRAALRGPADRLIRMADLEHAAAEEHAKLDGGASELIEHMYS